MAIRGVPLDVCAVMTHCGRPPRRDANSLDDLVEAPEDLVAAAARLVERLDVRASNESCGESLSRSRPFAEDEHMPETQSAGPWMWIIILGVFSVSKKVSISFFTDAQASGLPENGSPRPSHGLA